MGCNYSTSFVQDTPDNHLAKQYLTRIYNEITNAAKQGKISCVFKSDSAIDPTLLNLMDSYLKEHGFYTATLLLYGTIKIWWYRDDNTKYDCCHRTTDVKYNIALSYKEITIKALLDMISPEHVKIVNSAINNDKTTRSNSEFQTFTIKTQDNTLVNNIKILTCAFGYSCKSANVDDGIKFWIKKYHQNQ